ncbi:Molybdopterin oxydoreductase (polysulfide/thiosulfate), catalytic subunit A [Dissulfuribacter thermophilus]|uniref:Molybdopterin oxydoreductase (Polysulfide/thiosulfate), catalytic subunit A n=1 Tax=Dissulfuribacter thermophilus TaxID=1156395 RepID=A0A1B9F4R4_9BACT|nr:molybdopterin-dependent oxidoreductase [Dissulfuribacter thermophilus]OCC14912.1 Molybdopterin oxydoreductase (polysulfide/thiosulfate), catalytic subunit A [Dissulfuribacter thermophilus]
MKRRDFLKLSASSTLALAALGMDKQGGFFKPSKSFAKSQDLPGSLGAKEITSVCEMCFWRCPIVAKVKDGKLVKIEGNPKSPANGPRVCARGNSGVQLLYDPDRLKYPLKRVGERGEGKWAKITWDEALDEIAYNMDKVRKKYGPHALAYFDHGASAEFMREIFKALGTENYSSEPAFFQCVGPVVMAYIYSMGYVVSGTRQWVDMANAKAMLLVGSHIGENVHVSHVREFVEGLSKGAKLIVVDPRFSAAANKADIYLPIRPGTDTALLLAWINYVIQNNLYDKKFVEKNCIGFEKVKASVKDYSLEWAARICDLKVEDIKRAIEILAENRPHVAIHPGRHSTWYGRGDVGRHQALAILSALFGAVGQKGGLYFPTPIKKPHAHCTGCEGENEIEEPETSLRDNYPFIGPLPGTPTNEIIKATITGKPYPIRLWGINGVNVIQTIPNPYETMKAIKSLDFIFCEEMLPGETAIWSDIVLPGATYLERYDAVYTYEGLTPYLTVRQPVTKPLFEVKTPYWIAQQLAKRLNLECFTCKDEVEFIEEELKEVGLSLEKLNKEGGIVTFKANPYRKPDELKMPTESGKILLAVEDFEDEDFDPVPRFIPTPAPPKGYARLIYGRVPVHTFSRTMNNLWLNHECPENQAWINDEVAAKIGVKDGDEIILENQDGYKSNPIKAKVTPGIRPDCIYIAHGFGSKSKHLTKTYGKGASDQFLITNNQNDPFMGSTSKRTNFVKIIKGNKSLAIPEIRPVPNEIPRFQAKRA